MLDLGGMLDLGPHKVFILAAYGLSLGVIVFLSLGVICDHRTQKRRLAELENQGIRRRSSETHRG